MTIQHQYNEQLNRIWEEMRAVNNNLIENIIETTPLMDIIPIMAEVLTVKDSNGKFLFEEGQNKIRIELTSVKGLGVDFSFVTTDASLSQLFLSNCLLTGVDEVDQEKIENLKKIKFV
jgi:Leucine-rich repeat (LRR) protein